MAAPGARPDPMRSGFDPSLEQARDQQAAPETSRRIAWLLATALFAAVAVLVWLNQRSAG